MRLGDFILANTKPILAEWEAFAREIWPAAGQAPADLRDRAEEILRATASDMTSPQTAAEQAVKSKGESDAAATSARIIQASGTHAIGRVASGFDLMEIIAEYRMIVIGHPEPPSPSTCPAAPVYNRCHEAGRK
jgi:hypothetical protein